MIKVILYRKKFKLTQKKIAKQAKICERSYGYKENGIYNFTLPEMIRITNYFKKLDPLITMDDLFFDEKLYQEESC